MNGYRASFFGSNNMEFPSIPGVPDTMLIYLIRAIIITDVYFKLGRNI